MRNIVKKYIGYFAYVAFLFFGCSDNYDSSWKDKYVQDIDSTNSGSDISNIDVSKVEVSKTTEEKINNLKEQLDTASNDEIDEVVESVRTDIENSPRPETRPKRTRPKRRGEATSNK